MDIKLEKKPWYIRYRYYLAGGVAFLAFLIYVVTLSLGPSKLRIEQDNIQIAEVKNGKFMEYVDVEGVIQPILTIKVNARETGSVERIIGEEGSLLRQGDTILVMENPDLLRSIEDQRDDWEKQLITYREIELPNGHLSPACVRSLMNGMTFYVPSVRKNRRKELKSCYSPSATSNCKSSPPKGILTRLSCSGGLSATPSQRLKSNGRQNWIPLSQ